MKPARKPSRTHSAITHSIARIKCLIDPVASDNNGERGGEFGGLLGSSVIRPCASQAPGTRPREGCRDATGSKHMWLGVASRPKGRTATTKSQSTMLCVYGPPSVLKSAHDTRLQKKNEIPKTKQSPVGAWDGGGSRWREIPPTGAGGFSGFEHLTPDGGGHAGCGRPKHGRPVRNHHAVQDHHLDRLMSLDRRAGLCVRWYQKRTGGSCANLEERRPSTAPNPQTPKTYSDAGAAEMRISAPASEYVFGPMQVPRRRPMQSQIALPTIQNICSSRTASPQPKPHHVRSKARIMNGACFPRPYRAARSCSPYGGTSKKPVTASSPPTPPPAQLGWPLTLAQL